MEDFRGRTANDRAAALEAKYDPDDDIAMSRLGAPVEAGSFLGKFTKKLQGKSMGGCVMKDPKEFLDGYVEEVLEKFNRKEVLQQEIELLKVKLEWKLILQKGYLIIYNV